MLIDQNHYFKRFKKPTENNFLFHTNLFNDRQQYIESLNLSFYSLLNNHSITIHDSFAYLLINNNTVEQDIHIDGNFSTLVIEDISIVNKKITIINKNDSKIVFINHPQSQLSIEKNIIIENFAHLQLFLTIHKAPSFVKNNVLINLFDGAQLDKEVFVNTTIGQTFDLTTEIVHKQSQTQSFINFIGLNEGKLVSQVNSIVEKNSINCELQQHIKHILFNDNAMSYSKPSLMISTPCVASHGNSIGSIPEDWLFYLQTKGLSSDMCLNIIKKSLQKSFFDKINLAFLEPLLEYTYHD